MTDVDIEIDLQGEISIQREMNDHLRLQVEEFLRNLEEDDYPEGSFQIGMEYLIEALGEIHIIDKKGVPERQEIEPGIGNQYRDDLQKDYGFEFCSYCKGFRWKNQDENLCFICEEEMPK